MLRSVFAILAVASSALAQTPGYHALVKPTPNEVIPAGKTYTLEWQLSSLPSSSGPVNLILVGGPSAQGLQPLGTIGANIDPALLKYDWPVDASLGKDKAYGVKIELASDPTTYQWSNPFTISLASGGSSSSTSDNSTAAATTSTSSTSSSTSLTVLSTTTPIGNLSTTSTSLIRSITSTGNTSPTAASEPTTTTSGRASISTGAAATAFAGSFAVLGGVAMAVLGM